MAIATTWTRQMIENVAAGWITDRDGARTAADHDAILGHLRTSWRTAPVGTCDRHADRPAVDATCIKGRDGVNDWTAWQYVHRCTECAARGR